MARKPLLPRAKSAVALLQDERKYIEKAMRMRNVLVSDETRVWRAERLREIKREITRLELGIKESPQS